MSNYFRFKVLHVAWPEPQRKRSVMGARSPPNSITDFEIWPLNKSYITQKNACLPSASCVSAFCFNF